MYDDCHLVNEFYFYLGYCRYCGKPLDSGMEVIRYGAILYCSNQCIKHASYEEESRLKDEWESWLFGNSK